MSERKLIVFGTSSQVPCRERNQGGYFLRFDEEGFLFDPGEGTQRQLIHAGVSASAITKIFITHFHGDHCLGLAGILQRLSLDRVPQTVEVYFPASGQQFFENLKNASIYHNALKVKACPVNDAGLICRTERFSFEARPLEHAVDVFGYRFKEHDSYSLIPEKLKALELRGPQLGQLKRDGYLDLGARRIELAEVGSLRRGQSFAFVMDTRPCQAAVELARDVDMLVIEATYLEDCADKASEYGHLTASDAARIGLEAGAGLVLLTHYSSRYADVACFAAEAGLIHPQVRALKDGDVISLPRRQRPV